MRTPMTGRRCAEKTFYVFFMFGGPYRGRYAKIRARSYEKAKYVAWERWGHEVAEIYRDEETATAKIRAFGLREAIC